MRTLQRRFERSTTAQVGLVLVAGIGFGAMMNRGEHPVWWLVQGTFMAAVALAVAAVLRRKVARTIGTEPSKLTDLGLRLQHRDVPTDPEERAPLRRLTDQQLRQLERAGRWMPYYLGTMGVVAAATIVLSALNGAVLAPVLTAVGYTVLLVTVLVTRRRSLDRLHFMRDALHDHPDELPAPQHPTAPPDHPRTDTTDGSVTHLRRRFGRR